MKLNEKYYSNIAQLLNGIIPVKWNNVCLCSEVGEDSVSIYFYYYPTLGQIEQGGNITSNYDLPKSEYNKFLSELTMNIKELNNDFIANGQEKWTIFTFLLESSGKFKVNFDYQDLGEISERNRRKQWKEKYL